MKFAFGLWTVTVALALSVVAAYYSIVGLTAIFAAAVIPVIIMSSILEVGKVTIAIYLHSFWNETAVLMKTYLTAATIVLMIITSIGIFGFLSRAHIEQNANSGNLVAQIERIDDEIAREQQTIERANLAIASFDERVDDADTSIQARIESQERLINDINARLDRDIAVQNQLISQQSGNLEPLQEELERIREQRESLSQAQRDNDVRTMQALVGATVDGVLGPDTRRRITEFGATLDSRQSDILDRLDAAQKVENPSIIAAREEITRLQQAANAEIGRAQEAINSFREQLISVTTADNTDAISAKNTEINTANLRIDELLNEKFDLEGKLRILEVEVGPIKYIAELVYGEATPDLLEESVRWLIIILVLVFDPLAIVMVLAGISLLHRKAEVIDKKPEILHNEEVREAQTATNSEGTPVAQQREQSVTEPLEVKEKTVIHVEEADDEFFDNLDQAVEDYEEPTSDKFPPQETKPQENLLRVKRITPQNGSTDEN